MGRPIYDLTDQTIGRLTVIRRTDKRDLATGNWLWECRCECGSVCEVPTVRLRNRRTKSCDCLNEMLCKKKSRCAFYKKG